MGFAVPSGYLLGLDNPRRKARFAGGNIDNIGINIGEVRARQRLLQVVEAVIKFMVAEIADAVVQPVHRLPDRMRLSRIESFRRHIVAQRAALNHVAVINQHAVFHFRAGGGNQRGGAHQAELVGGLIFVVIEIHHITVQIGRFHDAQIYRRGGNRHRNSRQSQ